MRVLLVEDDSMIGQAVSQGLTDAAHAVDWVRAGEQGLTALRDSRFDMMLLDLGLSGMDGTEVLRTLRRDNGELAGHDPDVRGTRSTHGSMSWTWAPTTTWSSPSTSGSCWPACAPSCGEGVARARRCWWPAT